ncbi:transcriptional regulator [Candidatus Pacearchaeota archaeon]|nr:transcriptional regulator [Candidatus Pacearchaeota archaeon]
MAVTSLREVRLAKGLNQRELAEASHTPQALISAIERGVLKPWPKVAYRISGALEVPIEKLFPEEIGRLHPMK